MLLAIAMLLQEKAHRIPPVDLKQRVIWGTVCDDGPGLAFGGQDQEAVDGHPGTRVKVDGRWERVRFPAPPATEVEEARRALARARFSFFEGKGEAAEVVRRRELVEAAERRATGVEPSPRALAAIAWDPGSKLYVLFGGDHLDYLTNDTWLFDPAGPRWTLRRPPSAPPPRANATLTAVDGKIVLKGGYTYTSSTSYCGAQYRSLADGEWTYDVASNTWSGAGVSPDTRVYRTGRLHPDAFLVAPEGTTDETLRSLPANEWVSMNPPVLPALNRDWGTAVYDPDRRLILRWSGGHSAHGGSDVLQYHTTTNRWELTMPVEFPLGQLYSNTEYPEGVNFNRRPWITGHTYQSYGYDPRFRKMYFVGRREPCHVWDPDAGDWGVPFPKPKGMAYGDGFYTLTIASTPSGLVCWTKDGKLFELSDKSSWMIRNIEGKLEGSVVDNSTLAYDAKRERLLFWRKGYGEKNLYDGRIQAVDKDGRVSALEPEGREKAVEIPYLCQIRYDAANDLFLVGGTINGRTPAYDPAANRWITLKIGGQDPSGPKGRNVSLGLMYDAERRLFWAVDTNSRVYVLRLDPASADPRPLGQG